MTSTIILKTDSKLKQEAQQTAEELGLTLTSVINGYLSDFVQTKKAVFQSSKTKDDVIDPYGIFASATITENDIDDIKNSWMKSINGI